MTNLLTGDSASFTSSIGTWVEATNAGNFTTTHNSADGGVLSMAVTTGGANIAVASHPGTAGNARIPITAGASITIGAKMKQLSGTARNWFVQAVFYDAADANHSNINTSTQTLTVGSYSTISQSITVPANTVRMRLRVQLNTPAAGETFYLDDAVVDDASAPNSPPIASAGADQTVNPGATVTLTGSDLDSDGTVTARAWSQTSGTAVTLSGSGVTRTFTAPAAPATLVFAYTVTDDDGATGTDSVTVTVEAASSNLLTGNTSHFNTGLGTWVEASAGANFTLAHTASDSGAASIDVTTGGSNIAIASSAATSTDGSKPAVTAGATLTLSAQMKQIDGSPRTWRVEANFYADDQTTVINGGQNYLVSSGTTSVGSTVILTGTIVVPAGAARMRMRVPIVTPAAGETFHLLSASVTTGGSSGSTSATELRVRGRVSGAWRALEDYRASGVDLRSRRLVAAAAPSPGITGLQAAAGDGQVTLSWTEPNPSEDVTDYRQQYATAATGPWTTFAGPVSTSTTVTVTGLTNGTAYWFRVAPVRGAVAGTYSAPVTATPAGTPGPSNLRATPGNALVSLVWDPPSPATGVTDYSIRYRRSTATEWSFVTRTPSTETRQSVISLVNGAEYVFEVAAIRSNVIGDYTAGPVSAIPAAPAPTGSLFDEHEGFGNPGLTNPVSIVVTSAADSGAGTLRAAIAGNAHKHITFAAGLAGSTIQTASSLRPGSNTLIDGRGRNITIRGTQTSSGFLLDNVVNVTISDVTIRDCGNLALTSADDPHDALTIYNCTDIWLHHLDLSRCSDKTIDVQQGCVNITVSWCHFNNQEQNIQIGSYSGRAVDAAQSLTFHHNYFDGVGYRNPFVWYGRAHVFNNHYRDFDLWGARAVGGGRIHFERNTAVLVRNARWTMTATTDPGKAGDGFVTVTGNVALPGSLTPLFQTASPTFNPADFYAYTAATANQALADAIVAGAGPR